MLAALAAVVARRRLDALVALIGGACSLPLALVFPPLCHDRLVGTSPWRDRSIAMLGVGLAVFATAKALRSLSEGAKPGSEGEEFGECGR